MRPGLPSADLATAWVQSPLQLLSVVEAHAQGRTGRRTQVVLRTGSEALRQTALALIRLRLPLGLTLVGEAEAPAPWDQRGDATWVLGDAFSGVVQRALALHRPARIVVVDDGLAAGHLLRLLVESARPALGQSPSAWSPARSLLGRVAGRRLREAARAGRLQVVTSLPVDDRLASGAAAAGIAVADHGFRWLRSRPAGAAPEEGTVVLGTALVAHGLVHAEPYLELVRTFAGDGPVAYLPHRQEPAEVLRALAAVPGVRLCPGRLPVELSLHGLDAGQRVVGLPSRALLSLEAVLDGRGVRLKPVEVPERCWTAAATPALRRSVRCSPLPASA